MKKETLFNDLDERINISISDATADDQKRGPGGRKPYKRHKTASPEVIEERQRTMRTTGIKGAGLPRINMAFNPDNYAYILSMSQATGTSLTQFVNTVLTQHREAHADMYAQVLAFREQLKKGL